MASKLIISHDQSLSLQVTGARDEEGGSGIKSYSIYYATVESGIESPTIDDAQLLTTIDHLTSIPSTLDPAGETTSGYPSWEASEVVSGITRDHYHWDHVFDYSFSNWIGGLDYYFWVLGTDNAENSSLLASGLHPSSPFNMGVNDEQVVLSQNIEPKASVHNNIFLITGKGLTAWEYTRSSPQDYVTVPQNTELRIISPGRTGVVTKTLRGDPSEHYFDTVIDAKLLFIKVIDWETSEIDLIVSGIEIDQAHTLTSKDIIIGQYEDTYDFPELFTMFYGAKTLIPHTNNYMSELDGVTPKAHEQYLELDGTDIMAGDLNLGDYDINNVGNINMVVSGLVDSVDVSNVTDTLYSETQIDRTTGNSPDWTTVDEGYYTESTVTYVTKFLMSYFHKAGYKYIKLGVEGYESTGNVGAGVKFHVGSSNTTQNFPASGNWGTYYILSIDVSSGFTENTWYEIQVQLRSATGATAYMRKLAVWATYT